MVSRRRLPLLGAHCDAIIVQLDGTLGDHIDALCAFGTRECSVARLAGVTGVLCRIDIEATRIERQVSDPVGDRVDLALRARMTTELRLSLCLTSGPRTTSSEA